MRPNVGKKIRFMKVKVSNMHNYGSKITFFLFGYFRKVFSYCTPGAGELRFSFSVTAAYVS